MVEPSTVAPLVIRKFVQGKDFSNIKNENKISVVRYLFVIVMRFGDKNSTKNQFHLLTIIRKMKQSESVL